MIEISSLSAIEHLLENRPRRFKSLSLYSDTHNTRVQAILSKARKNAIACHEAPRGQSESVVATLHPFTFQDFKQLKTQVASKPRCLVVALDHIQDPQNLGALLRTAEGLGVTGVVVPKDRSAAISTAVYHASVGSVDTVPFYQVTNLGEGLRQLKGEGAWIVGSALSESSKEIEEMPDFEKIVLVLGNEGDGLANQSQSLCDWLIKIPMRGSIQSLNVSASGAILLYELSKTR